MMSRKSICFFVAMFAVSTLQAQQAPVITSSIDKNKILIGEPATLIIEVRAQSPMFIQIDTIPHFEFLEIPRIDTINDGHRFILKGVYKITSFDSGRWSIPAFKLNALTITDTIPVDVIFSEFDPSQDYHSIKSIIETSDTKKQFPWLWLVSGLLLLSGIVYYFVKRKKPAGKVVKAESSLTVFDEAMAALKKLGIDKPADKVYYSTLTDIFRVYILKRKSIRSLQKTTDDLVIQLLTLELTKPAFDQLSQVLRLSDFVKFARYKPAEEDNSMSLDTIRNTIVLIEKSTSNSMKAK